MDTMNQEAIKELDRLRAENERLKQENADLQGDLQGMKVCLCMMQADSTLNGWYSYSVRP